jgi:DNA adenine methylase
MAVANQGRSPLPWQGGKHSSAGTIISAFPVPSSYDVYCELFCGASHVLIHKPPYNHIEVINDLNKDLINFWMQCRDNVEALEERCRSLPYSREIYYTYHKSLFDDTELEPLERAVRWFYVLRSNFTGYLKNSPGGWDSTKKHRTCSAHSYHSSVNLFSCMQQRFRGVMIDNRDFAEVFKHWNKSNTLFYVDPPYISTEHYYTQPFTLQDHERLAKLLNASPAYVALSYYPHPRLDELYPASKWRRITWETPKHSQRTKDTHDIATEMLLCNYPAAQTTLWDFNQLD